MEQENGLEKIIEHNNQNLEYIQEQQFYENTQYLKAQEANNDLRYENLMLDQNIEQLRKQKQQNKNILYGIIIALFITIILLIIIKKFKK